MEGNLSNLALYRKYRSADFSEVVGQQHVVQTLQNAISTGKHSHAYLLTGPRGVGKTTVARIIAKQLNGIGNEESLSDNLDIIEIDGASNRGIDEIRSLREKVALAPTKLKYKVYIIDEVHMLTKEAFNALLKTLEEPPPHVVFIFATTEVHKLPDTIISRTQRFDFRPITLHDLQKHLGYIAKKEKINIDDEAITLIARLSRGGFRDAIGILDQVSGMEGKITTAMISDFTGLQDSNKIEEIFQARQANQSSQVIQKLRALYDAGADATILTQQMLDLVQEHLEEDKSTYPIEYLIDLAEQLHWVQAGLKTTTVAQLLLQTGLVRGGQPQSLTSKAVDSSKRLTNIKPTSMPVSNSPKDSISKEAAQDDDSKIVKSLSVIKHYNNSLYAVLRGSKLSIEGDEIKIVCRFSFHKERLAEHRNLSLIEKAFSKVYGESMHVTTKIESANNDSGVDKEQELMSSAMAILGGEVVDG